ncbi:hypothetical protein [Winogradskya consettensis]|uniref:hypothetical protein n=1 Tax=Winogradskya consettensis TaxID=113560 RepID=UPI001BB30D67|nr:hypothetical protein [Actinoplanes consettensis]
MGIDLELADCAAARYRWAACRDAGPRCSHEPDCAAILDRLVATAAAERPGAGEYPSEFRYRRFADINENMRLTGMGYAAEPEPWTGPPDGQGDETARDGADLLWRSQRPPGRAGIPAFKLVSNDRWVITAAEIEEALAAYGRAPADLRARLEMEPRWTAWLEWLAVARHHGGFEAE